jgi:hypothetical protein
MPVGICKLCLQNRVLEDSHLLPAALYRMSRWEGSANPNPMLISSRGRVQTSKQIKDYVLCHDCEQRFSRNGERYTMLQVNRKEGFKLLQTLRTSTNMRSAGGFTFYYETSALGVDRQKLAYFAMSVFWRAAVHLWHRPEQKEPMMRLGVYEEPIRKYLMEEAPFPIGNGDPSFCLYRLPRSECLLSTKPREHGNAIHLDLSNPRAQFLSQRDGRNAPALGRSLFDKWNERDHSRAKLRREDSRRHNEDHDRGQ